MTPGGNNQINPECGTFYNWPGLSKKKKKKINAMKIKGWENCSRSKGTYSQVNVYSMSRH